MRRLTAILAADRNLCIGKEGRLPWHFPEDLRFFKRTTLNGAVVMGRRTWDGLPRKPLPRRLNIVLSRQPAPESGPAPDHWLPLAELGPILDALPADTPVFLIGGARALELLWLHIDEFLLSEVDLTTEGGDTFLPARFVDEFEPTETIARLSEGLEVRRYRRIKSPQTT